MGKNVGPPKCRLCQTEHWSHQPHKFEGSEKPASVPKSVSTITVTERPFTPDQVAFIKAANNSHEKLLEELRASLKALEDKQARARTAAREGMRKLRAGTAKVRAKK